jgi:replicative DNA helicase
MNYSQLDLNILKILISNKKYALEFASNNEAAKLFETSLWSQAKLIIDYIKTYKEIPTERVLLEKVHKNPTVVENVKQLFSILNSISYDEKEFKHDVEKLKSRFAEKTISELKESLSSDITKSLKEISKANQTIKNLNETKTFERKTLKEILPNFKDEYIARSKDETFDRGLMTGYSFLDFISDGLRESEMLLIGADTGGGKSTMLMNMAIQLWLQSNPVDSSLNEFKPGVDVIYFSLEMPLKPCFNRLISRLAQIPTKKIKKATLDPFEIDRLKNAMNFIKKYPNQFEIVDIPRGTTIQKIESIFEEAKQIYNPKVVVVDYLGLMELDGFEKVEDWLKLSHIAGSLHEFARVHNSIMLSAVQLTGQKPSKDQEENVGLNRIGRSKLIAHHTNIFIQIEKRIGEKNMPDLIYHVLKCRDGNLGSGRLIKDLACATLLDDKYEDDFYESENINDISKQLETLENV